MLQAGVYLSVLIEIALYAYPPQEIDSAGGIASIAHLLAGKLLATKIYGTLLHSKLFTLVLLVLVATGTRSRKQRDIDPYLKILLPLAAGLLLFFLSISILQIQVITTFMGISWERICYAMMSLTGTILIHVAMDNVSKLIHSNLGKDRWNVEEESFMQPTAPSAAPYAINIPTLFYHRKKVHQGYIPLENLFRGCLLLGVPGSGKSFGVIMPIIRQMIAKSFTMCLYDLKYPDLGKIAYYHYLLAKQKGQCSKHSFHVINLNSPERSRRVNPLKSSYIKTIADASETAEALVEAMKKGDRSGGSDQFFTQSAVNFLASCIYFLSRYQQGKYSSFPHVLAFLNLPYDQIFPILFSNSELASLLSPFLSAYTSKAFDQLEGQVGTLKIFISRLATKETFWVFGGDDFDLTISSPNNPSILVLANDPSTQSINSASLSVVLNRITKLINTKGNLPVGLVIDEAPSLYIHRIEVLIAQARSNLSAVVLGLQELPMLRQQYGKEAAETITAIMGNVLSGSVRSKETLEWLERLLGRVKQMGESLSIDRNKTSLSLSERLEPLVPAGKIASLKTGEMVGIIASETAEIFDGKFQPAAIHCRVNLDIKAIKKEESSYRDLPIYYDFGIHREQILLDNYNRIKDEVQRLANSFSSHDPAAQAGK